MRPMASQISSPAIVYSTVYSGADQRKHQRSAPLVFVRVIHRWPVNFPHKRSITRKMFPFDDVIMICRKFRCRPSMHYKILPRIVMMHCAQRFRLNIDNSLQWRHNERHGISNRRRLDCLLNRLFRHRPKKTSQLHVTGLCEENPLVSGGFPPQRTSNAENASIWWRHHANKIPSQYIFFQLYHYIIYCNFSKSFYKILHCIEIFTFFIHQQYHYHCYIA